MPTLWRDLRILLVLGLGLLLEPQPSTACRADLSRHGLVRRRSQTEPDQLSNHPLSPSSFASLAPLAVTMQLKCLRMGLATVICTGAAAFAAALTESPNGDLANRLPKLLPLL